MAGASKKKSSTNRPFFGLIHYFLFCFACLLAYLFFVLSLCPQLNLLFFLTLLFHRLLIRSKMPVASPVLHPAGFQCQPGCAGLLEQSLHPYSVVLFLALPLSVPQQTAVLRPPFRWLSGAAGV